MTETNILEYFVDDMYLMLAATNQIDDLRRADPTRFPIIDISDSSGNIKSKRWLFDANGHFHTSGKKLPSVNIENIELKWGYQKDDEFIYHRDVGPASVKFSKLQKWHDSGYLHRNGDSWDAPAAEAQEFQLRWYQNGSLFRNDAPHGINISAISVGAKRGKPDYINSFRMSGGMTVDWNNINGNRVLDRDIKNAAKTLSNADGMNLFGIERVFATEMDSLMFWNEIYNKDN